MKNLKKADKVILGVVGVLALIGCCAGVVSLSSDSDTGADTARFADAPSATAPAGASPPAPHTSSAPAPAKTTTSAPQKTASKPQWSVKVTGCEMEETLDDLWVGEIELAVTNNGDETETAQVEFEYRDADGARIDTDTAYVRDIAPGDTVRTTESTYLDVGATNGTCEVTRVK
jgi:hypothetical protein